MDLEISTWTRRERLERIAAAERDRRAGRSALALASLGEPVEWPARIVLALSHLPDGEGGAAREVLESTLDEWAEQAGLGALEAASAEQPSVAVLDAPSGPLSGRSAPDAPSVPAEASFATPIGPDELDRAFAQAEAQTDEMLDVNSVAARVLLAEPVGLSEIGDAGPGASMAGEASETDATWAAASPLWSSPFDVESEEWAADPANDASLALEGETRAEPAPAGGGPPSRTRQIATLERWLSNLEHRRITHHVGGAR